MKTKQSNHKNSFVLLANQYIRLHGKDILMAIGVAFIAIGAIHTVMHADAYTMQGSNEMSLFNYHFQVFYLAFAGGALLWCGGAFAEFRSKERKIMYLMLPAGMFQKFLLEFIIRIVLYILIFPLIYWAASNLMGVLFHSEHKCIIHYGFMFEYLLPLQDYTVGKLSFFCALFSLLFTLPFVGATFFEKLPLPKTILSAFVIWGFFFGYIWLVMVKLELKNYSNDNMPFFMKKTETATISATIVLAIVHLALMATAYFKLKEKEV